MACHAGTGRVDDPAMSMIEKAFTGAVTGIAVAIAAPLLLMLHAAVFNPGGGNIGIGIMAFAMPLALPVAALLGGFIGKRWPQK